MQVPAQVEYERASTVEHALELLTRYGPRSRLLAGGHSLIPMMKLRLAQPETLIDINGLKELSYIEKGPSGELRVGALTRHAELLDSELAAALFPILRDAERVIADPVVRNWGTIGGSLCQADPSEDLSAVFAALRATMIIQGAAGVRTVPAREFHTGPYETLVGPAEILTEIRVPAGGPGRRSGSSYEKVLRRVGGWPVGAAGAVLWLSGETIAEAEESLRGGPATGEAFARAGDLAAAHCRPVSDQRGPADYKRHLARELTIRALRKALGRAQEADA